MLHLMSNSIKANENLIIERGGGVKLMPVPPDKKKLKTALDIEVLNEKSVLICSYFCSHKTWLEIP